MLELFRKETNKGIGIENVHYLGDNLVCDLHFKPFIISSCLFECNVN